MWNLDPIDGTKGFLRGEQYAVALALVMGGRVQVGVLGCPNLTAASRPEIGGAGALVVAGRGQGAWITALSGVEPGPFERLYVSQVSQSSQARILRSVESGHTNVDQIGEFARLLEVEAPAVSMDSQAKYAVLAAGQGDLYLRLLSTEKPNYRERIWDQAAGAIIIEEAGGRVTDLDGQPLDFTTGRTLKNNRGILASNGLLHPVALSALRRLGA
jgi:3'(2'), 5'-bisphosphate nucleotidase